MAARTDPELAEAIGVMEDEYARASGEILAELFPPGEYAESAQLELGMRFAVALMDGVALRGLVMKPVDDRPVELLKAVLHDRLDDQATRLGERDAKETT